MKDSFSQFLNDAGRIPLLTHEEEILLAREVQAWLPIRDQEPSGDAEADRRLLRRQKRGRRAYNRFFEANLRMVVVIARKYSLVAKELTIDDLVMEGCIGLSRAVELFDPARGYKFSTYAFNWIRQSVTRAISYFDRAIRLPVNGIERLSDLSEWLPEYKAKHGRMPSMAEMADFCDCQPETLQAYLKHTRRTISLNIPCGEGGTAEEASGEILDIIPDEFVDQLEAIHSADLCAELDELLNDLGPYKADVVRHYYGFNAEQMTLRDIASDNGIAWPTLKDHKARADAQLRSSMSEVWRRMNAA